jgi:hypothetical protein
VYGLNTMAIKDTPSAPTASTKMMRIFSNRYMWQLHLLEIGLTVVIIGLSIGRIALRTGPMTRGTTIALSMVKSPTPELLTAS